jgi:hypothetical protein
MNAEKQTFRKAEHFFHVGQRRGSLGCSEERAMRIIEVQVVDGGDCFCGCNTAE